MGVIDNSEVVPMSISKYQVFLKVVSSDVMAWLMPDWVKLSASAALVNVPQDTTFKNT